MDGIFLIDKEKDYTSRDVVNIISKKFKTKKVGHAGTLDPLATGMLVIGINKGTKILEYLTNDFKEYEAEVILGIETDSLDITGNIIKENIVNNITNEDIKKTLKSFLGKSNQEVPKYSAVKVKGKKLYEYARNNEDVALPSKEIEIKNIELTKSLTKENGYYTFSFKCLASKGTYIRSLIRDIGLKLNTLATMNNLRRLKQGIFEIEDSKGVNEINVINLISLKDALINYKFIEVSNLEEIKILNGNKLDYQITEEIVVLINKEDKVLAIYQKDNDKIKPVKVFT